MEFSKYVLEDPEMDELLPEERVVIFMSEFDQEVRDFNLKMAKDIEAEGEKSFTPLESPVACSGDGDKIPFGANTGFKAPWEESRWKVGDLLTGST